MKKRPTTLFKRQAVEKALSRGALSLESLAQDMSVGYSALQKWIRKYKQVNHKPDKEQRPKDWTREEQLQALIDTSVMDDKQRNLYCREKGLYPHHLEAWRQSFLQTDKETTSKSELKALKDQINSLQKEIRRKDKALAETAALLVLQKKFQALLEDQEK